MLVSKGPHLSPYNKKGAGRRSLMVTVTLMMEIDYHNILF
jgi:hypothetical protein